MHVEVVRTRNRFEELRDPWNDLLDRASTAHVFLRHEILLAWLRHLAPAARLHVTIAWEADRAIAAVPLVWQHARYARMPVRKLALMGGGWGYGGLLASDDQPEALEQALEAALGTNGWHIIELVKMPASDVLHRAFDRLPQRSALRERSIEDVPHIDLTAGWEAYVASRNSRMRYNWRRRGRQLSEQGSVRFVQITPHVSGARSQASETDGSACHGTLASAEALDHMREVASKSWKAKAGTAVCSMSAFWSYYGDVVRGLHEVGRLEFGFLFLNETPIAYVLIGSHGRTAYAIDSCYAEDAAHYSPAILCRNMLLEKCDGRFDRCDFVDRFDHKLPLANGTHAVDSHRIIRRSAYPAALHWVRGRLAAIRRNRGREAVEREVME